MSDITSDFYQFVLSKIDFVNERQQYQDIQQEAVRGWITSDERDKKWYYLRVELSKKKETVLWSFAYLRKLNIIPLLIFDDLDPLDLEFNKFIYNESYTLSHNNEGYKIKVIISMRPRINGRLEVCTQAAIRINARRVLDCPNIAQYLEMKIQKIHAIIRTMDKKEVVADNNFKIIPQDIATFFQNYLKIILQSDTSSFIENMSGGNMRVFNELIHIYVRSGFINSKKLITDIIDQNTDKTSYLSKWIVYSAIITHNHHTVFGQQNSNDMIDRKVYTVNILCNGYETVNHLLIRFHLLSFFVRAEGKHTNQHVIDCYKMIMTLPYNENELKDSINRAIKRLFNGGLIGSYDCGFIADFKNIDTNSEFSIEDLGKYYMEHIIKIFEYLSFMKDDINFGLNELQIHSCLEVKGHSDRFSEVVKYLQYLYFEETKFYNKLDVVQKQYYKDNFSPMDASKTLYVQVLCENMLDYVRQRLDWIDKNEIPDLQPAVRNDLATLSDGEKALTRLLIDCKNF
jgi:hypothetical protein